jgi:stearoyl-CoA desaturase (Delta-9 desaturase)
MTTQFDCSKESDLEIRSTTKITIKNNKLRRPQIIHAFIILVVPFIGTIFALWMIVFQGISQAEVWIFGVMYLVTMFGISIGFHRLFSHSSYRTSNLIRVLLAIAGSMSAQGPLIYWVSNHRRHHYFSDKPGDTHSPYFNKDGKPLTGFNKFWYSHIGWTFSHDITNSAIFSKDLTQDPLILNVSKYYFFWVFLGLLIPAVVGGIVAGSWIGLLSGFLWGGCLRLFLIYHVTNSINSITHLFGKRPFKTKEYSTNNAWLALPTGGESWHNNHHAFPHSAIFGLFWWQIDLGGIAINILEFLGLVWQVKRPTNQMIKMRLEDS